MCRNQSNNVFVLFLTISWLFLLSPVFNVCCRNFQLPVNLHVRTREPLEQIYMKLDVGEFY
jgi:hypothetical protein